MPHCPLATLLRSPSATHSGPMVRSIAASVLLAICVARCAGARMKNDVASRSGETQKVAVHVSLEQKFEEMAERVAHLEAELAAQSRAAQRRIAAGNLTAVPC